MSAATRTAMRTIRDRLVSDRMGLDGLHHQPMERCHHPGAPAMRQMAPTWASNSLGLPATMSRCMELVLAGSWMSMNAMVSATMVAGSATWLA